MTLYAEIREVKNENGKPVFTDPPTNYNLYAATEPEKYTAIHAILNAGATLDAVSGCGSGYYIQIKATPEQADRINKAMSEGGGAA